VPEIRPDPEHDAVCASAARHRVVVAPPGTGKTYLAVRLAGVIAATLRAEARVLLLTFSTQARTQLEHEVARQLRPELRGGIEVTNYHRFFWHAVHAYRRALGLPLRVDLGSRRRREAALARVDSALVRQIGRSEGLLESLAEHAFVEFRDRRTPPLDTLEPLLAAVREEHGAGRLVFDDLGALFWSLLEQFPAVDQAYRARYPVVIADEHQDASALQDAVARHLGRDCLVIFADPMQLIHGFRGASPERLDRHRAECDAFFTLNTPHRWHGSEALAEWLIAVRARLTGDRRPAPTPAELAIEYTPANRGLNAVKPTTRFAALHAFREGCESVAVLARSNREVGELRRYLSQAGLKPWQIGGGDFEEARVEIEQLPLFRNPQSIAFHALERLDALVSTLERRVVQQVRGRLGTAGVNLRGAGAETAAILRALEPIYRGGAARYFDAMVGALEACLTLGHHLPRTGAVRALRETVEAFAATPAELDQVLERYSARVVAATHVAPRLTRGLFVMTAHQAKGKEFDAVILANASRQFFPDDEESRRLFYVAITRASRRWRVVAPDRDASPLLATLTGA
jgi:superfamily I DNA/RNA helicase